MNKEDIIFETGLFYFEILGEITSLIEPHLSQERNSLAEFNVLQTQASKDWELNYINH